MDATFYPAVPHYNITYHALEFYISQIPVGKVLTERELLAFLRTLYDDLRHTYATLAIQNGTDFKTVSESLGHFSVAFTMDRYGHVSNTMRRSGAEKMAALIENL